MVPNLYEIHRHHIRANLMDLEHVRLLGKQRKQIKNTYRCSIYRQFQYQQNYPFNYEVQLNAVKKKIKK